MTAGHLVAETPLRHPGQGLGRAGNAIYLALARAAGRYLARCEIVESVYVRRSLAAGEVAFGRSDIDLGIRLRDACAAPGAGERLVPLRRAMQRLARALPIAGEAEVFAASELDDWVRLEPVREAMNGAAVLVCGAPFRIPPWRITPDDGAARFCFWFDRYLPAALAARHRRNLGKFALEMWASAAIARRLLTEPPLSRLEMAEAWREAEPASGPPAQSAGWLDLAATIFTLASAVHARMLPPLPAHPRVLDFTLPLPPMLVPRRVLVGAASEVCVARVDDAVPPLRMTPEALDLYLQYVNPFAWDLLPDGVRTGFPRPPLSRYLTALERWTHGHIARRPAFGSRSYGPGPRAIAYARHAARALARGEWPVVTDANELGPLAAEDARTDAYFRGAYARVYAACEETRALINPLRTSPR